MTSASAASRAGKTWPQKISWPPAFLQCSQSRAAESRGHNDVSVEAANLGSKPNRSTVVFRMKCGSNRSHVPAIASGRMAFSAPRYLNAPAVLSLS